MLRVVSQRVMRSIMRAHTPLAHHGTCALLFFAAQWDVRSHSVDQRAPPLQVAVWPENPHWTSLLHRRYGDGVKKPIMLCIIQHPRPDVVV